jgi:hypothetical protein
MVCCCGCNKEVTRILKMCLCSWLHAADLRVWFRVHGHCIVLSLAYDVLLLLLLLLLLLQWTCPRSTVVETGPWLPKA